MPATNSTSERLFTCCFISKPTWDLCLNKD